MREIRLVISRQAGEPLHRPISGAAVHPSLRGADADRPGGSPAVETILLGWNGDWRELDLSKRNVAALSRAVDRYWDAGRPVPADGRSRSGRKSAASRPTRGGREPKAIRAWAAANGIEVSSRGRIPAAVERQYNEATQAS